MSSVKLVPKPAQLLKDHATLFTQGASKGPVLDLACGEGQNGIYLAVREVPVICCDRSAEALSRAKILAAENRVEVKLWQLDLESEKTNPFVGDFFAGILVFRYLHRPLIPCIKKALKEGGLLMYETFTIEQPRFGKPHNPDFLLKPGELYGWFMDWAVIHHFEGIKENPDRAIAQIVCRKPSTQ